ncbi:MAG: glycoside hydrolase, partial [Phycisphaerae bacterium]|nr:glycoside hydrolase [Phycisphaerae bacterium]
MKCLATICLMLAVLIPSVAAAREKQEGGIQAFLGEPKLAIDQVFKSERFPNIVVALDGTVLATWGTKSVRVRRSEDGGETWGQTITIASPGFHGGGTTV